MARAASSVNETPVAAVASRSGGFFFLRHEGHPQMTNSSDPIVRFHQLTSRGRAPMRADRSACGTLPVRAVRYCEALTSRHRVWLVVVPPIDLELLWDGSEIFWRCDEAPGWMPLLPSAQIPDYAVEFDAAAPETLKGCRRPS